MDWNSIYKVLSLLNINTWILKTQNSNSPVFDLIVYFHDFTIIVLILIILIIFFPLQLLVKFYQLIILFLFLFPITHIRYDINIL